MISICYEACKKCNLKCDYCISSDNVWNEEKELPYQDIINRILVFNPKRIVISGGEPLLDPLLIEKIRMIKEHDKNIYISLSTNGSVEYDFKVLKEYINCIDISLPAIDDNVYEKMRGEHLVDTVKKNIMDIKASGVYLRISYVLTKVNSSELFKVLDFAKEAKVDEVRIGRFLSLRNALNCKDKYEISQENIDKLMAQVYQKGYDFEIIPPIDNIEKIEKSYLNIDFNGQFFYQLLMVSSTLAKKKYISKLKTNSIKYLKRLS